MAKDEQYKKLINSVKWQRLRRAKLGANPLCERCLEAGRVTAAAEVHHIVPVEFGGNMREKDGLAYDLHNLQSLCHACHVEVHRIMGLGGSKERAATKRETELAGFRNKFK